ISRRNPELAMVLVAQLDPDELTAGRRLRVDIHGHIVDRSAAHADQLALRAGPLEMQAAQYPAAGAGMVVLDERQVDAYLTVAFGLEGLEEESALIAEHPGLDDQHT